ncbi:NAD(P)H-binding protein [Kitasatospora sp. NBC_01287]|uniref:NAD(P)H-binding protein n=1 Tax=Kitasatospora sp. NBC_01287 TaxID=2903573 RepID=UPI00224E7449|nr:NAD(P)H-binding protein [Kitasatospora sp. NBC_01287]MCX4748306.1 NAD(P)H-binding protein [Kitasatospora sp. NBC_01287]
MDNPVVVVGGAGRVGRIIVQRLLERQEDVRVVGRSAPPAHRGPAPEAVFSQGDVRDPRTLAAPLAGCSALVYCVEPGTDDLGPDRPETTVYQGVRHAIAAAAAGGNRPHVVLISQLHATHQGHPLNAYGRLLVWRHAGEDALRDSGLPYTVVRPGWLIDDHGAGRRVRLEQGDRGAGQVARVDVAEACVQALYTPAARGVTFEIFNEPGVPFQSWSEAFGSLVWDRTPVA